MSFRGPEALKGWVEKTREGVGGGKKQIPRANGRPRNDTLAGARGWDALKHAATRMVKTKRQNVPMDALPLVLLEFYCCG
jgi:hypothetical protein